MKVDDVLNVIATMCAFPVPRIIPQSAYEILGSKQDMRNDGFMH